jgi:hypothetical protein
VPEIKNLGANPFSSASLLILSLLLRFALAIEKEEGERKGLQKA